MGTSAGVGISHHRNPKVAGQEAAAQALAAAGIDRPDLVIMFSSVGYRQPELLQAVREATGEAPLCGCSGAGIIACGETDESNFAVAVLALRSDELRFRHGLAHGLQADSSAVGRAIAEQVAPELGDDTQALFIFPDGLTCNFDALLRGLGEVLPAERQLPLLGGLAGENWTMSKTYQYCDGEVISDGVAWMVLSGSAQILSVLSHGCVPIGAERTITRSAGNVIYEIDDKPVLEVLQEYLTVEEIEQWLRASTNLSLGFRAPSFLQQQDEYIVRFMPTRNVDEGSVQIYTEVAPGTPVWMTRRDYDKVATGIAAMGDQIIEQLGGKDAKVVFHFDCAGRGKVIFRDEQKQQLLQMLQHKVGADVPWIGLYTYGEIGPVGGHNCFHNYTAVLAILH
jgi:hypothetical protein